MKRYGVAITTFIASLLAFVFLVSASAPYASAAGLDDFVAILRSGGLQATSTGALQHAGFKVGGQTIVVMRGSSQTLVELFDYPDQASMLHDWRVQKGAPVTAAVSDASLSGHLALNDGNRILVYDDVVPTGDQPINNDALVRSVGQAFLSLPSSSSAAISPNLAAPTLKSVSPPHTGSGGPLVTEHRELPLWAGLLWTGITASAIVFAAAGGLVLLMKVRRLA